MQKETEESANKRIAKNTILIYIRLFTTMFIGLYTSRVVLQILGVSDFGLFSVVGGVLAMFTFITSSLGTATSRFLNVEMGKPDGNINRIFNVNLSLHVLLALIILLLAEFFGLYYIYNYLNIAEGKLNDAVFVYQVAIITACLGIINEPYSSLLTSHERFAFLTNFDIINTLIRLGLVIILQFYDGNSLRFYAIIMGLTTVNTFVVFHYVAAKDYAEMIKLKLIYGWKYYKDILSFSNWNILSTLSFMARSSGSDMLLNSFFGTSVNGAYAISRSVNNYIGSFSMNFDVSSSPQIIQSYSSGNLSRCYYLVNKLGRFCLLLFEIAFFPLYVELEFILTLWLGEVPEGALLFCKINLLLAGVALSCGGFGQLIHASGKVKWFKIEISAFFLICIPIGYWLFTIGYPPHSMLVLFLIADIIQRGVQMVLLKRILNFNSLKYIREAYIPPICIAIIMGLIVWGYSYLNVQTTISRLAGITGIFGLTAVLVYYIGLTSGERKKTLNIIRNKLKL